uniref:Uncharacterized protein n=1 Tax=Pseudodiaptomus poplesia TaxID=213370 RepID=A0A1S6GLA6_9MAXI|nr:hypothetical protein [Pseudodiaptomus poplesia]
MKSILALCVTVVLVLLSSAAEETLAEEILAEEASAAAQEASKVLQHLEMEADMEPFDLEPVDLIELSKRRFQDHQNNKDVYNINLPDGTLKDVRNWQTHSDEVSGDDMVSGDSEEAHGDYTI